MLQFPFFEALLLVNLFTGASFGNFRARSLAIGFDRLFVSRSLGQSFADNLCFSRFAVELRFQRTLN